MLNDIDRMFRAMVNITFVMHVLKSNLRLPKDLQNHMTDLVLEAYGSGFDNPEEANTKLDRENVERIWLTPGSAFKILQEFSVGIALTYNSLSYTPDYFEISDMADAANRIKTVMKNDLNNFHFDTIKADFAKMFRISEETASYGDQLIGNIPSFGAMMVMRAQGLIEKQQELDAVNKNRGDLN